MSENKFKRGFATELEEDIAFEKEQNQLKDRHGISGEDVVVVEKPSLIKFLITLLASIVLFTLATIGLLALIYPEPRAAMVDLLVAIKEQIVANLP